MKYRNPWDHGWRRALIFAGTFGIVFAILYAFKLGPKLEVCRTYYKEMSTWGCVLSAYGLPHVGQK